MKQSQGTKFFNLSSNYFVFLKISLIYQLPECPYSYLFVSVEVLFTGNKEGNIWFDSGSGFHLFIYNVCKWLDTL